MFREWLAWLTTRQPEGPIPSSAASSKRAAIYPGGRRRKPYLPPEFKHLTAEQGALVLVGRAWAGDEQARDLLGCIFPEPDAKNGAIREIAGPR
jgi:hypothetical protein